MRVVADGGGDRSSNIITIANTYSSTSGASNIA